MAETGAFVLRTAVKWGDCDPDGFLYTPRFAEYVAAAHFSWFEWLFGATTRKYLAADNLALPAKALTVDFRSALSAENPVELTVRVLEIRVRTFSLGITATKPPTANVAFVSKLTLICIDRTLREARPLPERLRQELIAYAASRGNAGD